MGTPQRGHYLWGKWENFNTLSITWSKQVRAVIIQGPKHPGLARYNKGYLSWKKHIEIECWMYKLYFRKAWEITEHFNFPPWVWWSLAVSVKKPGPEWLCSQPDFNKQQSHYWVSNSIWIKHNPSSSFVSLYLSVILLKFSKFLCAQLFGEYVTEPQSCRLLFLILV